MKQREKGFALVWALVLLGFAASLSALLLERGRATDLASKTDTVALKALYAAEGGLALARQRLSLDASYAGETLRVGECDVTVRVQPRDGGWVVRSCAGGTAVEATLRAAPGLPAIDAYSAAGR
jgi:type II secretory pathway component PulK